MSVVINNCTAFMLRERCFKRTDPATPTLGSHFCAFRPCFLLGTGMPTVINTEYNNGVRVSSSEQTFSRDSSCISEAEVFLSSEGFLADTMSEHSFEISLKKSLKNSVLNSLTLKTALAMSNQVPCSRHLPSGSSSAFNLRAFVWEGQVTWTWKRQHDRKIWVTSSELTFQFWHKLTQQMLTSGVFF